MRVDKAAVARLSQIASDQPLSGSAVHEGRSINLTKNVAPQLANALKVVLHLQRHGCSRFLSKGQNPSPLDFNRFVQQILDISFKVQLSDG